MYKLSTYLEVVYVFTYLPIYETYFLQKWLTRWNQIINSVEVHPQLSNHGHPVDGVLVGGGSLWPHVLTFRFHNWLEQALLTINATSIKDFIRLKPFSFKPKILLWRNIILKTYVWLTNEKSLYIIRAIIEGIQSQVHRWWWHELKTWFLGA
jgi:hypothetical protein